MTAGTSNGLAMIRRAIPRPRSSILLEVAKETLHPSALCRACTVGQIRARTRPAVGSGELFIWALPKSELIPRAVSGRIRHSASQYRSISRRMAASGRRPLPAP